MHFICRSFTGHNQAACWSQYWENEPDNPSVSAAKGHLFGLINLSSTDPTANVSQTGREIIHTLDEKYFSLSGPVPASLQSCLQSLLGNPIFSGLNLSVILAVTIDGEIFVALLGPGSVMIHRGHQLSLLLKGESDEIFQSQGRFLDADRLVLTSTGFFQHFGLDYLRNILLSPQIQTVEEAIVTDLSALDDQNLVSAAIIQCHFDEIEAEVAAAAGNPAPAPVSFFNPPVINHPSGIVVSSPSPSHSHPPRRLNILIALIILICLAASAYFGFQRNRTASVEKQYQKIKTEIQAKITQSQNLVNLNLDQSQQVAKDGQALIADITALKLHPDEVKSLSETLQSLLSQTGSSADYHPDMFFDTSLINSHPAYQKLVFNNSRLDLFDPQNHRLDELTVGQKSHRSLSSDSQLSAVKLITVNQDQIYLLTSAGVATFDSKQNLKTLLSSDPNLAAVTDFQFWNGNIYFLTPDNILKSAPSASAFSPSKPWLKTGQTLFPKTTSFAINGSIWTITSSGLIQPYNLGAKENFSPSATISVTSASRLLTALNFDDLVFTDGDNLIYVMTKTGQTQAKYNLGSLKIVDITLDPADKIIYALCTDQKIYRINL